MISEGTVPTICRQCDMRCGILVKIASGRIVRVTEGHSCGPVGQFGLEVSGQYLL